MKKTYKGFTLVELLVVMVVIGVLIAILAPAIASTRERSQMAVCINNIKQITMGAFMYADDHNTQIPDVPDTANYVENSENIYKCPRDTRSGVGMAKPSYTAWLGTPANLLPATLSTLPSLPSETVLYVESNKEVGGAAPPRSAVGSKDVAYRHDNRTVIVFADGHVFSCDKSATSLPLLGLIEDEIPADD